MGEISGERRRVALSLCAELLSDIEQKKITSVGALRRLHRIATIINDRKKMLYSECELNGYSILSDQQVEEYVAALEAILDEEAGISMISRSKVGDFIETEIEKIIYASKALPSYRVIKAQLTGDLDQRHDQSIQLTCPISEIESIYEEITCKPCDEQLLNMGGLIYAVHPKEIANILYETKNWVYEAASNIYNSISEFDTPLSLLENMVLEAEQYIHGLSPLVSKRLHHAFECWETKKGDCLEDIVDSCRRALWAFAETAQPNAGEALEDKPTTDQESGELIEAFIRKSMADEGLKAHARELIAMMGKLLAQTDALARRISTQKAKDYGELRSMGELVLVFTFLCIAEMSRLTKPSPNTMQMKPPTQSTGRGFRDGP
jgi:hypothetical protein